MSSNKSSVVVRLGDEVDDVVGEVADSLCDEVYVDGRDVAARLVGEVSDDVGCSNIFV